MTQDDAIWAILSSFSKFGAARLKRLADFFTNPREILSTPASGLIQSGIEPALAQEFVAWRHNINTDKMAEALERENISVMLMSHPDYPERLKSIYQPPFILFSKGQADAKETALAVVGARKFSPYGRQTVEKLVFYVAGHNITIVSGLALGIDALAHQAALEAGGRTVAVLGSGLDKQSIYPTSNRYLSDKIISQNGQLLSEFPPGTSPLRHHFPMRNRIISGVCQATLVIEAASKSGSLITAYAALEQGRDVLTVPGSIFSPLSEGTNQLIKKGATPITSGEDILAALDLSDLSQYIEKHAKTKTVQGLNNEEEIILGLLSEEAIHIELIIAQSGLLPSQINSAITILEIKGLVQNVGGMQYIKKL